MPAPDDAPYLLLHEIRLRGFVDAGDGAAAAVLLERGLVTRGARGLHVTAAGRVVHATWARVDPDDAAARTVRLAYERFLPLNVELLRVCNDWQVRAGGVPNDHRDARYDWSVLDRLRTVDERAGPLVTRAGRAVGRFASYRPRLRTALAHVDEGRTEWLASPRLDSYHTVWMQLHEDLLLALGADRAGEQGARAAAE